MIVDCFSFFNEYDLLEGRLEYLYNHVDYFLIVESNLTHSGVQKPFNFLKNIRKYKKYKEKILYHPIDIDSNDYIWSNNPGSSAKFTDGEWQTEWEQRNYIGKFLKPFPADTIVLLSDLDEIPNRNKINDAIFSLKSFPAVSMAQQVLVYNLDRIQFGTWYGTVVTTCSIISGFSAQHCRDNRYFSMPHVEDGGWHLTYWGGVEKIQEKIKSFAHQEFNQSDFTDTELIKRRIQLGAHPLEPLDVLNSNKEFSMSSNGLLPNDFIEVFQKYSK